jgi:hypothetical protein
MKKKYEIFANDKNLVSTCIGILVDILTGRRGGKKYTLTFDETFELFQERVVIDPLLWKKNRDGEIKWKQAIRNINKVHKNKKTPDALTAGELIALEGGGIALPNYMPKGESAVVFPIMKGLDVKPAPKKKKLRARSMPTQSGAGYKTIPDLGPAALEEVRKTVAGLRRVVSNIRNSLRDNVVVLILTEIKSGKWTFDDIADDKLVSGEI